MMRHDRRWYLEPVVLFLVAIAAPLATLHHAPTFDELYHLLAARSWAEDGSLQIAEGVYRRSAVFTMLIGWLFRWLGSDLAVARLPSLLAAGLLTAAVFVWTRSVAGRGAAWIAAVLLGVSPLGMFLAGYIRPYTIHALLFFLGSIALYAAVHRPRSSSHVVTLVVACLVLVGSALYFQRSTIIGSLGLGVWLVLRFGPRWVNAARQRPRLLWLSVVGIAGIAAVCLVVGLSDAGQRGIQAFLGAPAWSAGRDARFYHWMFLSRYPTLWTLLPIGALMAISRRGAPAVFASTMLGVGLLLHSVAGMKAERYVLYLMPFFFLLWGIAVQEAIPVVARLPGQALARLSVGAHGSGAVARASTWAGGGVVLLFLLASNPAVPMSLRMVKGEPAYAELGVPFREAAAADWQAALPALGNRLRDADVVVATNGLKTLYEFGRYDIEFSTTRLSDIPGATDFAVDPRTGKRVIASAASLETVIACYASGLFLSPPGPLEGADAAALGVLEKNAEPLDLPTRSGLRAFAWRHEPPPQHTPGCIMRPLGASAATGPG